MNKRLKNFAAPLLAVLAVMAPNELYSATNTWTGLGTGNNWRQGPNWASLTIPAVGDDIVFAGSVRPNPNNNNSAVQGVFSSITFASTATNFLIVGAATPALTISNGITNNSVNTQTISNGITLGNNITVAASSGNINLVLAVGDAGAGRGITKTGDATLTLSGTNTFTGGMRFNGGTLVLANPVALAAGSYLKYESQAANDMALVKVAYAGAGPNLGNLDVDVSGAMDLGTNSLAQIRFATATNWTVGTTLTITNSTGGGKLYILDATSLNLTQIVSAENPTYVASVDANGLVTFIPPPPAGSTFASWLGSTSETSDLLLQYAFGSVSATQLVARAYLPQASVTGGNLVLTYYVRQGTQGLNVVPELSTNLAGVNGGFTPSDPISPSITDVGYETSNVEGVFVQRRTATVPIENGAARKFLRVRVTQN